MQTNRHTNHQKPLPPQNAQTVAVGKESEIGVWRGSKANLQFWLSTIVTLSLFYWLHYRHNAITLTTRRITQVRGNIFTSNETSISIQNVTNIDVNISLLGRLFNYGDISIQSAGSDATEIYFVRLANPTRLREIIFDLKDGKYDETKR
jgi:membrane protein YdbS with pleckstrin-like domain